MSPHVVHSAASSSFRWLWKRPPVPGRRVGQRGVHPNVIDQWKRPLIAEGKGVFDNGHSKDDTHQEALIAHLYKQINRLRVEREWLKKTARFDR